MSPPLLVLTLVGANDSLKVSIQQAKAAILYIHQEVCIRLFLGKQEQGNLFLLNVCTVLPLIQNLR